jgi:protein TonB
MGEWRNALMSWLEKHKTYPEAAREEGAEGRVLVRFTVTRDGRVLDASLAQSSGSRALDAAALNLAREARPSPFPAGVMQSTLSVTVPLAYQLE